MSLKRRQDSTFPSKGAFGRFGSKLAAAKRINEFCRNRGGYEDVIKVCKPIGAENPPHRDKIPPTESIEGFVYLIKSGRYHKIGRSNSGEILIGNLEPHLPGRAGDYAEGGFIVAR